MSTKHDHALIEKKGQRAHPRRKGAVVLVGVALVALVAVTTASTNTSTAAPVHLYWANNTPAWGAKPAATTIGRARLDGTGVEHSFVSGTGRRPCGVALDRKHIYWAELQGGEIGSPDEGGAIGRANRDGTAVNASFIPTPSTGDCGVAIAGGHIYWATVDHGTIGRANVDGTGVDGQFISGLAIPRSTSPISNGGGPCGIAVAGKYIYWIDFVEGATPVAIGRANLDGTGVNKRFIPGRPANGCGIAVAGGHIYWTNAGFVKSRFAIGRANLDGTGVDHRFIRTAGGPCGIAVYQGHIYWGEWKGSDDAHPGTTIGRANLDGSAVEHQFITGIHDFCGGLAIG
jgi:hypothetical protein